YVEQHPVEIARCARTVIGAPLAHRRIPHPQESVPENMPRVAAYVPGRSGRIHSPRRAGCELHEAVLRQDGRDRPRLAPRPRRLHTFRASPACDTVQHVSAAILVALLLRLGQTFMRPSAFAVAFPIEP